MLKIGVLFPEEEQIFRRSSIAKNGMITNAEVDS